MAASKRQNPVVAQKGRAAPSDDLSGRVYASGMIQPGAHPEFDQPTLLDKAGEWFSRVFKRHDAKADSTRGK